MTSGHYACPGLTKEESVLVKELVVEMVEWALGDKLSVLSFRARALKFVYVVDGVVRVEPYY